MIRTKNSILFAMIIMIAVLAPFAAFADVVSWDTQFYQATANIAIWDPGLSQSGNIMAVGPPLPITAIAASYGEGGGYGETVSQITDSSMYISLNSYGLSGNTFWNETVFKGTFTASSDLFLFSYDKHNNFTDFVTVSAPFYIKDLTTNTYLRQNNINLYTFNPIYIPMTVGHNMEVGLTLHVFDDVGSVTNNGSYQLNYNMAVTNVAPEPISSLLFITGGTLLAGRSYLKIRKKA